LRHCYGLVDPIALFGLSGDVARWSTGKKHAKLFRELSAATELHAYENSVLFIGKKAFF